MQFLRKWLAFALCRMMLNSVNPSSSERQLRQTKVSIEKRCISLTKGTLFKQWKTMIVGMFCILFILHMNFLYLIIQSEIFLRE